MGGTGRHPLVWLAGAVVVLLLVVARPFGDHPSRDVLPRAAAPGGPPTLTGPPRGSLAGDVSFVDAVRRLSWTDAPAAGRDGGPSRPEPPLETRWVVFAGDVAGGRWALVVSTLRTGPGPAGSGILLARWFGGPEGATPDRLITTTVPAGVPDGGPTGIFDQSTGTLVVVAAPGDVIEVSARPAIGPDGEPFRAYRPVESRDGVAVVPLRGTSGAAVSFRAVRNGEAQARTTPWTVGDPGSALPLDVADPRGTPSATAAAAVDRTARRILAALGLLPRDVEVTALWTGNVPGPGPATGEAVLVAVTLRSGAVLVDGEWEVQVDSPSGDYVQGGDCGLDVLPAGPPAEERVHAMACEVVDPRGHAPLRSFLVVVTPPQVALVRIYDGGSGYLTEWAPVDGVVVTPLPRGTATVEAVTAGGISLGRTDLLGRGIDLF
jgi:hypothetical protein